jgi:TetR/AcrR family transcriptional repressor of nem operon
MSIKDEMARKRSFDEAAVLRSARDVFWRRGYEATSLERLQAAMGLSRSSLYEAFGSKRELFARVLAGYLADVIDPRLAPLERPDAGFDALTTYFEELGRFLRQAPADLAGRGCLLLNTATELSVLDDEAAAAVEGYRQRMAAVFLTVVTRATKDGDLSPDGNAADRADLLTAQVIGLFLTSRMSLPAAAGLADTIGAQIRSWRPPVMKSG